jgi:hypothetical protein
MTVLMPPVYLSMSVLCFLMTAGLSLPGWQGARWSLLPQQYLDYVRTPAADDVLERVAYQRLIAYVILGHSRPAAGYAREIQRRQRRSNGLQSQYTSRGQWMVWAGNSCSTTRGGRTRSAHVTGCALKSPGAIFAGTGLRAEPNGTVDRTMAAGSWWSLLERYQLTPEKTAVPYLILCHARLS